jgi:hypothetical protein
MYKYKKYDESQISSHFFIKTPNESILRISLIKPNEEEYVSDYLEDKVRHLLIINSNDITLNVEEAKAVVDTLVHIVYEFLAYNECVIKIEVKHNCGKDSLIKRFISLKPDNIKGFLKENPNDCSMYYFYNKNIIEGTDLLSELIREYEE